MGIIHIMERGGDDLYEYKKALKMAKKSIDTLCELSEEMEDKYSERGGYRMRGGMGYRDDMDQMDSMGERRGRDSMGRYR